MFNGVDEQGKDDNGFRGVKSSSDSLISTTQIIKG